MTESHKKQESIAESLGSYYSLCITFGIESPKAKAFFEEHRANPTFARLSRKMEQLVRQVCRDGLGR
jgi:hypothetical protein